MGTSGPLPPGAPELRVRLGAYFTSSQYVCGYDQYDGDCSRRRLCASMIAYKLLRKRKDGTLGPLFINARQRIPLLKWLWAEDHPTRGFAHRPGWHCTMKPVAPHLSTEGRVWCKVEIKYATKYQRPESQGGTWVLAKRMRVLEVMP